ncbi:MAG: hypothetical protein D6784_01390 [Chloroflexi bacterium]|nr:MAG: hypothetical protein D6784_01390 [Chloroflexota bacterium]
MQKYQKKGRQLVALFIAGVLVFNFPLLFLINRPVMVGGIPLLYLGIFLAWTVMIVMMALIIER